jgi:hypothetical protein
MDQPDPPAASAAAPPAVARRIVGFHLDEAGDWVAELECGHGQHVRHRPPWINRPWVVTPAGRKAKLGATLPCKLCAGPAPGAPSTGGSQ